MGPKSSTLIVVCCTLLLLTNWSFSHGHMREGVFTPFLQIDLRGLGAGLGSVACIFLVLKIWRLVRILLDERVRISREIRLWKPSKFFWLLVPMGFGFTYSWHDSSDLEGRLFSTFEYSGSDSWISIVVSAVAIVLFQLHEQLRSFLKLDT